MKIVFETFTVIYIDKNIKKEIKNKIFGFCYYFYNFITFKKANKKVPGVRDLTLNPQIPLRFI